MNYLNIGTLVPRHAHFRPEQPAVVFKEQRLTYQEFGDSVNRLANVLWEMGLRKGDKVATILPNCLELLMTYWAVAQIGVVVVPLSPLLRGTGLTRLLNDSDSQVVITNAAFADILTPLKPKWPAIQHYILTDGECPGYCYYPELMAAASPEPPPYVEIRGDDPYNIIYSSGTTGLPKGIVHTHAIRAAYCQGFSSAFRITPESVILHTGSIIFNGAFLTLMPAFFLGATYVLHPDFDVERMIETVATEKATHIMMVPSQIVALLHSESFCAEKLASLEMILTLGAPLHLEHKQELNQRLPGRFYELYGLTEGFVTILDKNDYAAKPASVGCPPPLYEMRIVGEACAESFGRCNGEDLLAGEVGEIVGRGPITMPGYYKRPDLTAQAIRDGWLYTGDMGYVDEDGYLYLVDRKKDLIISGGVNVYPKDIEEILVQHPAVREAAVFGIPSTKWGETPLAAVILTQLGAATEEELRDWVNQRVEARFQKVSAVVIKEEFPRRVAGKTLKRVMREAYWRER